MAYDRQATLDGREGSSSVGPGDLDRLAGDAGAVLQGEQRGKSAEPPLAGTDRDARREPTKLLISIFPF